MLRSIRARLSLAFVVLAVGPILVVAVVLSVRSFAALKEQAILHQQTETERVGSALENYVRGLENELILTSEAHRFLSLERGEQRVLLDELLAYEDRFEELILLEADGRERVRSNRTRVVLDSMLGSRAGDPAFRETMATGQHYFGPVTFDARTGEPLMTVALPLESLATGSVRYVLLGVMRLKKIWDLLAAIPHENEIVFIVDQEGNVVGHPDPSVALSGARFELHAFPGGIATGLGGEEVVLATKRVVFGSQHLHVVAQIASAKALALGRNIVTVSLAVVFCALVAAVVLSFLVIGTITRPLQGLTSAVRAVRQGDLSGQVEVIRSDEVGEVALAFNDMTARLQSSIAGMQTEIDERRKAEEALRQSRSTLRQMLDTVPQSIFWKDREGVYLGCNSVFARAAGLSDPEQVRGLTDFDLPWPREEAEAYRVDDREVLITRRVKWNIVEPLQQADGTRLWINTTKVPLVDGDGNVFGVLGIYEDITQKRLAAEERENLEKQLRQSQKMEAIGTLAGGIAHDFNNILAVIFGYTEMGLMQPELTPELRKDLEGVFSGAERARDLVKQILTFSRRTEHRKEPLQISLVVKEALKMLRASIPTTIEFRQDIASNAMALADPTQIHQIVMNLCTNAYHAMRETGGTLAVSLREAEIGAEDRTHVDLAPGRYLCLEVSDTGCGMAPEVLDKVFEPFFTTKKQGEGTGMGLAVVHGIVKSHRGHITVYSEPGKGTSFRVYLPVTEQEGKSQPVAAEPEDLQGHGEHILFIDDEEQLRSLGEAILSRNGYRTTVCPTAVQALELFSKDPEGFDLVVTDMTMPYMTGAELAQKLLAVRPSVPVIICTGQSDLINREKALAMGCRDYLNKPVMKQVLLAAVKKGLALQT